MLKLVAKIVEYGNFTLQVLMACFDRMGVTAVPFHTGLGTIFKVAPVCYLPAPGSLYAVLPQLSFKCVRFS